MEAATLASLRGQLEDRRARLRLAASAPEPEGQIVRLLQQVDTALAGLGTEDYARCLVCGDHVGEEALRRNPLLQYCLCQLTPGQQRALESDLELARRIQAGLLPDPDLRLAGWEAHYRYEPAGIVSGDYCDLWTAPEEGSSIHFAVGDVSGKGVAASLLMAHLQAAFRSLIGAGVPLSELVARVNRQLLEAGIASHYATLACGRLGEDGAVEMVNAGHCPPVIVRGRTLEALGPTGVPVGLLADQPFEVHQFQLRKGDSLVLYTDGLTEARRGETEFGLAGLQRVLESHARRGAADILRALLAEVQAFADGPLDDVTVVVLKQLTRPARLAGGGGQEELKLEAGAADTTM